MKTFIKYIFCLALITMYSCESLVDGINENPNDILISDVDAELFMSGAMLANTAAQAGHLNRISGMYSGQLVGLASLYSNIYGFDLSTVESNGVWRSVYVGVVPNLRHIRSIVPDDKLAVGISKVVEAHAIGTAASLFGDVPYTEISNPDIQDPKFDSQASVYQAMIDLLDDAISDLSGAGSRSLSADIYYGGDADKWKAAANTLKARYLLQQKDYAGAYAAAQSGISSADGSLQFIPRGDANIAEGDKNLFWTILEGSRAGDIGTANSYLMQILDPASGLSRANSKTNETARFGYYSIDDSGGSPNQGIIEQFEAQNLISYAENQLILAEAGARTAGFDTGLGHLNDLRAWMNTGALVNANFQGEAYTYEAYTADDFASGGMENADGLDVTRALLKEIIEERYVSGFGMYIPYNDSRRLRKSDGDIAVPFFLVDGPEPPYSERMPYADDELNSNENAPEADPGIFAVTPINQ